MCLTIKLINLIQLWLWCLRVWVWLKATKRLQVHIPFWLIVKKQNTSLWTGFQFGFVSVSCLKFLVHFIYTVFIVWFYFPFSYWHLKLLSTWMDLSWEEAYWCSFISVIRHGNIYSVFNLNIACLYHFPKCLLYRLWVGVPWK